MRILVVSDTHHDRYALERAVIRQPRAEAVIHLGDGEQEAAEIRDCFPEKMFYLVRGNCDWGSTLPPEDEITLGGKHIFFTHGYKYGVKYGIYNLVCTAHDRDADIVLFGHTHNALTDYDNGLYIMNPGTLNGADATYGIIDITESGIVLNIIHLN